MQPPHIVACCGQPQQPSLDLLQDEQRLELLKEIGGTRVYEERRKESVRVMEDCQSKRTHIQDLVGPGVVVLAGLLGTWCWMYCLGCAGVASVHGTIKRQGSCPSA
jgi:hypothetical protein